MLPAAPTAVPVAELTRLADLCQEALRLARQTLAGLGPAGRAEVHDQHVVDIATRGDRVLAGVLADLFRARGLPALLLSEETGRSQLAPQPTLTVAVDELDGTDNYFRGPRLLPHCTVITVFAGTSPRLADALVAGVVEHLSGHLWLARRGAGCTLDGAPVRTSRRRLLDRRAVVAVDHYSSHAALPRLLGWYGEAWVKDFGSAALHLAGVASGLVDAYATSAQKAHELGAGYLLVREAGGCLLDWTGKPLDERPYVFESTCPAVVAATPELAAALLARLS